MWDVFLDTLNDSLMIFVVLLLSYIIIEIIETSLAQRLQKQKKWSPVFGAMFGLIPQCGFSVVATDLYSKRHITMGTLIAVFIATSDEALPIMLASPNKIIMVLPLLAIKLVTGIIVGYLVDLIYQKSIKQMHEHENHCSHTEHDHIGCCDHDIENHSDHWEKYFFHPLIHSIKIFLYIFIINFAFATFVYFVGEQNISNFLSDSKYFAPIFATLVGLIPNCASSVIISNLYIAGGIGFGACVAGLISNAGLGLFVLFKQNKNIKQNFSIIGVLVATSLVVGYATSLICNFS